MTVDTMIREPIERLVQKGDLQGVRHALQDGESASTFDKLTRLPILHIAIGDGFYEIVESLIEFGAQFGPDRLGRWPSVVAAVCQVNEEMCDLVVEAEARAIDLA